MSRERNAGKTKTRGNEAKELWIKKDERLVIGGSQTQERRRLEKTERRWGTVCE